MELLKFIGSVALLVIIGIFSSIGVHTILSNTVAVKQECVRYSEKDGSCIEHVFIEDEVVYVKEIK